jgi:uncharacterized membrane protein
MCNKIKHLDYIQQTISRMATVSFQIKAWNIALVTAVLSFSAGNHNPAFLWAALLPAIMLWLLDSFFLRQERLFRLLYDAVRLDDSSIEELSMDTRAFTNEPKIKRWRVFLSETLLCFHGIIVIVILLAMYLLAKPLIIN